MMLHSKSSNNRSVQSCTCTIIDAYRFATIGQTKYGCMGNIWIGNRKSESTRLCCAHIRRNFPDAGKSVWGSGFLPSVYQGVQCRSEGIRFYLLKILNGMDRDLRKASIDAINEVNKQQYEEYKDPEILSRISQYEMAYQMQIAAPEVMNINDEPAIHS